MKHKVERYYVLKNRDGKDKVVVCLLKSNDSKVARGVAVCSNLDEFRLDGEESGMDRSYCYAMNALAIEGSDYPVVRNRSIKILRSVEADDKLCGNYSFTCHSYYQPSLNPFEKGLMGAEVVS